METSNEKNVIGYQLTSGTTCPNGLFSFVLFRNWVDANDYLRESHLNSIGFNITPVYEGDVENPTII